MAADYAEVDALLKSEVLRAVEQAIASRLASKILYDHPTFAWSEAVREIGLSGLTIPALQEILKKDQELLIDFAVAVVHDQTASKDEEEYPEGEEPDEKDDANAVHLGYGNGVGIRYAILVHFLRDRTAVDLRAYLKARRIPRHGGFAKELARVFRELASKRPS